MTAGYRSTTLGMVSRFCPRALDYYEARVPSDKGHFQVGIAAHAVLQAIGEDLVAGKNSDIRAIGESVGRALVTHGRAFEGEPEPPMTPEQADAGVELAIAAAPFAELSPDAFYEYGLAVDRRWNPVDYDSAQVYYRAALDALAVAEFDDDEGYPVKVVTVTDYKSAWSAGAADVDSLQLRGQALVAVARHPDATVIRRRIYNLQTRQMHTAELLLDDDGRATLDAWRRDIDLAIAAADARGPDGARPARPGAGCLGCPYLRGCDPARAHLRGTYLEGEPELLAQRYAVAAAVAADLAAALRTLAAEQPIEIPGGSVGFHAQPERYWRDEGAAAIVRAWTGAADDAPVDDAVVGLVAAFQPGATAIERVGKRLYPHKRGDTSWKDARAALESACLATRTVARFGVQKSPEGVSADGSPQPTKE